MRLILARSGNHPDVHAWQLPDEDGPCTTPCGQVTDSTTLQHVHQFAAAPCPPCLLAMMHAVPQSAPASTELPPPDMAPTGQCAYGAELRGDTTVHLIPSNAAYWTLDGLSVAHAACCSLVWGPYVFPPTAEWRLCRDCAVITEASH